MVKIANKALHCLAGDFDNFASNHRLNANDKTTEPHLQAANIANWTKMLNLANVATSPATSRSLQMRRQMRKHSNCEFQQQKLLLFVLLIII